MDYGRLRQFDAAVRSFYLRLKEIWVAEKYARAGVLGKDAAARQEYYGNRAAWTAELVDALEAMDVPASDFNSCRDNFVLAGKVLQQAYGEFAVGKTPSGQSLAEYGYYVDAALEELKNLWDRYHGENEKS
ncbi:MAG: hypothetical protein ACOX8W_04420 [bacterium]|jgi:hypothetical protein